MFFETDGRVVHLIHIQASGNPVKIGDGCATVTGYKLPQPLVPPNGIGKAGARFRPQVRISVWLCSSWLRAGRACCQSFFSSFSRRKDRRDACPTLRPTSPSKRRMRPARFAGARRDSLNAFILRFAGV